MAVRSLSVACLVLTVMAPLTQAQNTEQEWIIPIVATGALEPAAHFQTTIRLIGFDDTTAEGSIGVLNDSGELIAAFCPGPVGPPPKEFDWEMPGSGSREFRLGAGLGLITGWVGIRVPQSTGLQAAAELNLVGTGAPDCPPVICSRPSSEITSSVQIEAVQPAGEWRGQAIITGQRQTALAIVNPSHTESIQVDLALFDLTGQSPDNACPASLKLGPRQRITGFIWDLFKGNRPDILILPPCNPGAGERPEMFHGSFQVIGPAPAAAAAVHVLFPEGKMVNVPLVVP